MSTVTDNLERRWARAGVAFHCAPAGEPPDLERLFLDTARCAPSIPRLRPLVVTWLTRYGVMVARHRLRRLAIAELQPQHRSVLGLLIEEATHAGAHRDLLMIAEACEPQVPAYPLDKGFREPALALIAEQAATPVSRRWGLWAAPFDLKPEAIRPVEWILGQNPAFRDRAVRKGDLRSSIVESLRWDLGGLAPSISVLARVTGATRVGVVQALASLQLEGAVIVGKARKNDREVPVTLAPAA